MPDAFRGTLYWFIVNAVLLVGAFFCFERSLSSDMAVFIGILAGIVVLYSALKKNPERMPSKKRASFVVLGLLIALFSFANEFLALTGTDMHFWNPPYSIGEFGVLLSGLSVAFFAYIGYSALMIPAGFPAFVITAYQVYEIYQKNLEWIAAPLLGPTTQLAIFVLNQIGINASGSKDYVIHFIARDGIPAAVQIVIDCTGIWSLSAFSASVLLVSLSFPKVFSRKGALYLAAGYIGTYAANILRIVAICLSVYFDRSSGLVPATHMNAGWIAFSGWMMIFWYMFFSTYLLKKEKKEG
jgi:exosortase/archaeosortase family protein